MLKCARLGSPGGPKAAGVSHHSPRAQTSTFEGPGLPKHHQNSTRRHPEREEKNEFFGGRGKKRAKFWVVQEKGGPGKGGPNQTLKNRETRTHATQQTHNTQQVKFDLAKVGFGQWQSRHQQSSILPVQFRCVDRSILQERIMVATSSYQ